MVELHLGMKSNHWSMDHDGPMFGARILMDGEVRGSEIKFPAVFCKQRHSEFQMKTISIKHPWFSGLSRLQHQLLIVLASQWCLDGQLDMPSETVAVAASFRSLLLGAIIWLVGT